MEYYGDQATVMPDNTNAFLHLNDQFAQLEQQRQAQKQAQINAENERQGLLNTGINKEIYNGDYLKNDAYNPLMRKHMQEASDNARVIYKTQGLAKAQEYIHRSSMQLGEWSNRVGDANKNLIAQGAAYQKLHPLWDGRNGINQAATNLYFKKDNDGKFVPKEANEIDPNADHLGSVLNGEHGAELYSDAASNQHINEALGKEKLADNHAAATYDAGGNLSSQGYKSNLPAWLKVTKGPDGKLTTALDAENYKLPNGQAYVGSDGKPIPTLKQDVYDKYFGTDEGKALIDKKLKKVLAQPVSTPNGDVQYGPDSEYANMQRQKIAYDELNNRTQGRYPINIEDDKTLEKQREIHGQRIQDAHLAIAKKHLSLSEQALQMKKDKEAKGGSAETPDFLDAMINHYGEDHDDIELEPGEKGKSTASVWNPGTWGSRTPDVPATIGKAKVIPENVDPRDLDILVGKANSKGVRPIQPTVINDANGKPIMMPNGQPKKGYIVNPTSGTVTGAGSKEVNDGAVQKAFEHSLKKGQSKITPNSGKQSAIKGLAKGVLNDD